MPKIYISSLWTHIWCIAFPARLHLGYPLYIRYIHSGHTVDVHRLLYERTWHVQHIQWGCTLDVHNGHTLDAQIGVTWTYCGRT